MSTARRSYTHFFTSVELGDYDTVNDHLNSGFDPTKSYKMDGKVTTPIKSALKKGNNDIANLLLNSRKIRVEIHDLLTASKYMAPDSALIAKLAAYTDTADISMSEGTEKTLKSLVKTHRLSTAHVNYDLAKRVLEYKVKNRCPPDEEDTVDEEDEDEYEMEDSESDASESEVDD